MYRPTSFKAIYIVNIVLYLTFQAAYITLYLLNNNSKWFQCFDKSKYFSTNYTLYSLFITILINGDLSNLLKLWEHFYLDIYNNLLYQIAQDYLLVSADFLDLYLNYGLFLIAE